jgi:hypothetical protein
MLFSESYRYDECDRLRAIQAHDALSTQQRILTYDEGDRIRLESDGIRSTTFLYDLVGNLKTIYDTIHHEVFSYGPLNEVRTLNGAMRRERIGGCALVFEADAGRTVLVSPRGTGTSNCCAATRGTGQPVCLVFNTFVPVHLTGGWGLSNSEAPFKEFPGWRGWTSGQCLQLFEGILMCSVRQLLLVLGSALGANSGSVLTHQVRRRCR